jgi:hypothetical protein
VIAGSLATCLAVVEAVFAKTDVELPLTERAILFAITALFDLFALAASDFGLGGCHEGTLALDWRTENVPLVTWRFD